MNFTIMLPLMLLLMLVAIIAIFTTAVRREECHNAKSSPQKAPTAQPTPEEETAPAQPDEPTAQPTPEEETAPAQPITEPEIRDKIRAGLTRAQAIEVITRQAEHDAMLARTANHGG